MDTAWQEPDNKKSFWNFSFDPSQGQSLSVFFFFYLRSETSKWRVEETLVCRNLSRPSPTSLDCEGRFGVGTCLGCARRYGVMGVRRRGPRAGRRDPGRHRAGGAAGAAGGRRCPRLRLREGTPSRYERRGGESVSDGPGSLWL